jgi:hypothetical protein
VVVFLFEFGGCPVRVQGGEQHGCKVLLVTRAHGRPLVLFLPLDLHIRELWLPEVPETFEINLCRTVLVGDLR